ncbi:hypothetical protein D6D21_09492 [Aureobasidium pullulans]|uniref:TFIIS-type domain-containing protein n=1 Tax=Aureobasidium pullulans TaxID=5580 RepID=A0AB74IKU8_AURPU|nr:hypothetical protein D6D21_09492 [Aureobasidium pullulans]
MSLVGALLFCNDCGGLLERCPASQANIDCDVCGKRNQNKWPTSITTESAPTAFPSRLRDARSEIQVLSAEDRETWAMTTTACPQCANPEMRFRDVQLRGADEGNSTPTTEVISSRDGKKLGYMRRGRYAPKRWRGVKKVLLV